MAMEKMKSNKSLNVSKLSGRKISCKIEGNVVCKSSVDLEDTRNKATICPYGVPLGEVARMQNLIFFWMNCLKTWNKSCCPWRGGKKVVKKVDRVMVWHGWSQGCCNWGPRMLWFI